MNIAKFRQKLASSDQDYEKITLYSNSHAHFRFIGPFEHREVIWDAHLYTLAYYVDSVAEFSQPDVTAHQFIHVGDLGEMGRKLEIGLNLPGIQ